MMATAEEERPTIGERYSSATESSNLKMGERRSDVDVIIAAGLVPDNFGLTLYRLMFEFDAVRGPVDAAKRWVKAQSELAATLRAEAVREKARKEPDMKRHDDLVKEAKQVQDAAIASLRTEFVLVLSVMTTLREARYAVGQFAQGEAWRKGVSIDEQTILLLAGRALEAVLDPLCQHCEGRGYNGGGRHEETGPQVLCRPCRNSGKKRESIGRTDAERLFAGHLLMEMDSLLSQTQADIKTGLRHVDEAKRMIAKAGGWAT